MRICPNRNKMCIRDRMEGVTEVRPYVEMQPEFGTALAEAEAAGVKVLFLPCKVGRDWLKIDGKLVKKC